MLCRQCGDPPGVDLCRECKKELLQHGTLDQVCDALQDYDGSFYTVNTVVQNAYHYTTLTFTVQDETDLLAVGRGRTEQQSKAQCVLNYRKTDSYRTELAR